MNWLICDVIPNFCSLQELSNNVQDSSLGKSAPAVQMKWFLCDVIYVHCWWKRWEILSSCRSDPVFDGSIHQTPLLLAKIKWIICDVIPDSHLIRGKQNRTNNPQERIFSSKWIHSSVMWYLYIADEKGERFCLVPRVIQYLTDSFTKARLVLAIIKSLICDVVTDYHLIGRKCKRTSYPQEGIFPSKWSEPCVIWYIYTAHAKNFVSFTKHKVIFRGYNEMEQFLTK